MNSHLNTLDMIALIDTHTHLDYPVFDNDRLEQLNRSYQNGVHHLIIAGYHAEHFKRIVDIQAIVNDAQSNNIQSPSAIINKPTIHSALGLHPNFILQHSHQHLSELDYLLAKQHSSHQKNHKQSNDQHHKIIAIGEIGLDTFNSEMKQAANFKKQQQFFIAQLDMAAHYQLPVLLHIRKAHADSLRILKQHNYNANNLGGIAHSFSGGEQEAKAFIKLGFKLGVTGQITNPNAKKLRRAIIASVKEFGIECLVIETDSPDMIPLFPGNSINNNIHNDHNSHNRNHNYNSGNISETDINTNITTHDKNGHGQLPRTNSDMDTHIELSNLEPSNLGASNLTAKRNTPANLIHILNALAQLLNMETASNKESLAKQLWHNSCQSLRLDCTYPYD